MYFYLFLHLQETNKRACEDKFAKQQKVEIMDQPSNRPLSGKACIVTGGSKGIGRGIAVQLAYAGAEIWFTGRNNDALTDTAKEIEDRGGKVLMSLDFCFIRT